MKQKDINFRHVTVSDDFAESVIAKIDREKSGLLSALPAGTRVMVVIGLLAANILTGIMIGRRAGDVPLQGMMKRNKSDLIEFRKLHHLYNLGPLDRLLSPETD
jgi:hypothetical protein